MPGKDSKLHCLATPFWNALFGALTSYCGSRQGTGMHSYLTNVPGSFLDIALDLPKALGSSFTPGIGVSF